jgi:rare lipoprotein A
LTNDKLITELSLSLFIQQGNWRNTFTMKNLFPFLLLLMTGWLSAQELEYGLASVCPDDFHGRPTAYGDVYDKSKLTCSHKIHPYGTMLKVRRMDNGQSVTVKVIDQGPFISGTIVEVSRQAAQVLGIRSGQREIEVSIQVVGRGGASPQRQGIARPAAPPAAPRATPSPADNDRRAVSAEEGVVDSREAAPGGEGSTYVRSGPNRRALVGPEINPYRGIYKISVERPEAGDYGLQMGIYSGYDNALRQIALLQSKGFSNILLSIQAGDENEPIFKVILGPFVNEKAAQSILQNVRQQHRLTAFMIRLSELR